jgi:hypothetical protein
MIQHGLFVLVLLTSTAIAQPGANDRIQTDLDALIAKARAEAPSIETVVRGTVRRARRALSIGPTVGLWTAAIIDPGDIDAALTLGIGFETFQVPVLPSLETLQDLVVERVKAQIKQRILDTFKGRQPEPLELETLVKHVYDEVRGEILGLQNVRPKTFERPQYTVGFEANRLFGADRWLGRTRVGIGVWKVTLGLSAAVGRVCRGGTCDDAVKAFLGPEIVLHALPSDQPRASVIDVFVRADFQANGRGVQTYDQLVLGARYLLDVF